MILNEDTIYLIIKLYLVIRFKVSSKKKLRMFIYEYKYYDEYEIE